jgi:hypothetical protein
MSDIKETSKAGLVTRRQVVTGLAVVGVAAALPLSHLQAGERDINPFLKASSVLTGIALDTSYVQLGHTIWDEVTKDATVSTLQQWRDMITELAKLPDGASTSDIKNALQRVGPEAKPMAIQLTKVWYTGRIVRGDDMVIINYDEALVWRACDFTKPPVTCGGPFGYWSEPYLGGRT